MLFSRSVACTSVDLDRCVRNVEVCWYSRFVVFRGLGCVAHDGDLSRKYLVPYIPHVQIRHTIGRVPFDGDSQFIKIVCVSLVVEQNSSRFSDETI